MLIHRCPWCGVRVKSRFKYDWLQELYEPFEICPNCNHPYTGYSFVKGKNKTERALLIISVIFALLFVLFRFFISKHYSLMFLIAYVTVFLFSLYFTLRSPNARYYAKGEKAPEKAKQNVSLEWRRRKAGGLTCPKIQIAEGEIFPACFTDENGQPISTALCVVLENIEWADSRNCICDISFVSDDTANENLLCPGNRFYLYHRHSIIAEGAVKPAFE